MSVHQMGLVWGLDLPGPLKFTLLALADHADHQGDGARPSVGLLAWKTGNTRRTVQRHLRDLEARGLIEAVSTSWGGHLATGAGGGAIGKATTYRLHLDEGAKLTPYKPRGFSPDNPQGATPGAPYGDTRRAQP